ncbi:hypothetical protein FDP41_007248 [Naegleria fowleri]|uniref:Uncharacterized protein n=1 Tax=Naegleria fowleri TaxID=5763 RepID=A0A6A5BHE4_NAEFO|nr:uncharacterized protein FDP41_007248 [Naegleria fowleri]KAF0973861.1 hypothetical protein FDP41_007248 [Naegleria fowleri]
MHAQNVFKSISQEMIQGGSPNDGDDELSIPSSASPIVTTSSRSFINNGVIYLDSPSKISECLESFLEPLNFQSITIGPSADSLEATLLQSFPSKDYVNSILNRDSFPSSLNCPLFVYRNKDMISLIDSLVINSISSSPSLKQHIDNSNHRTCQLQQASNDLNKLLQELSGRNPPTRKKIEKKRTKSSILERRKCRFSIQTDSLGE